MNKRMSIFLVLAILWMAVIFAFSSRDGDESTNDSHEVGLFIGKIIIPNFEKKTEEEQIEFAEDIDFLIRKIAHGTEYAILGMLLCGAIIDVPDKRNWFIPWVGATLYACTDEIHQMFVPGRDGKPLDVLIDSTGAFIGAGITLLVIRNILNKRIERKQ